MPTKRRRKAVMAERLGRVIKSVWLWLKTPLALIGVGLILFAAVVAGFSLRAGSKPTDLTLNLATELAGVAFTVLVVDALSQRRERERLKAQLIREMGSTDNGIALRAVEELRARRWGFGWDTSLQGVSLIRANLQGAILIEANLQGADLSYAELQGAFLVGADLQGARLGGRYQFGTSTFLPDQTKWTPDTDMARFTNPKHPEFWRSDDPDSPAYRGSGDSGDD